MFLRVAGSTGVRTMQAALLALVMQSAWPADMRAVQLAAADPELAAERFDFDLPAQPLADALRLYASLTRQPTLFRSDLVDGRSAAAVQGRYSAAAALFLLLEGTGLTAERADAGPRAGFVLMALDPSSVAPRARLNDLSGYPGEIQARVLEALCADARTRPGSYRSLMRFRLDAAGQIRQPRLLSSTGDAPRDAAVLTVLQGVRVGGPPPSGLPQPVTLLIAPPDEGHGDETPCAAGALRP